MSEIRYGRTTLPECCGRLAERVEEPYRSGLARIFRRMQEDESPAFPQVFAAEMGQALATLPLEEGERKVFLAAMSQRGFADAQMQLRSLERTVAELERVRHIVSQEIREKSRMAVGLGGMGGLLLVILLM